MMEQRELLDRAKEAMQYAYAPYSSFRVGACLLCEDGSVYTGCNIENASYGATVCAERTAIFKAASEGKRRFLKIAIVSDSGGQTPPCGICRQVLAEFMPDGVVILEDADGGIRQYPVKELLPLAFSLEGQGQPIAKQGKG